MITGLGQSLILKINLENPISYTTYNDLVLIRFPMSRCTEVLTTTPYTPMILKSLTPYTNHMHVPIFHLIYVTPS